jgi:hypothetical protein
VPAAATRKPKVPGKLLHALALAIRLGQHGYADNLIQSIFC